MNTILVKGVVGKEPQVTEFDCRFTLADNRQYTGADGQVVKVTTWHNVVVKGGQMAHIARTLKKGDFVLVEGRLENRQYTNKDGVKMYWTFIETFDVFKAIRPEKKDSFDDDIFA